MKHATFQICSSPLILCWLFRVFCLSKHFRTNLSISAKICLGLYWISRTSREKTDNLIILRLPIYNIKHLFIDLVLPWFCSSESFSFSHRSCRYLIRFIPMYFILGDVNINGIVFLISNFTCSLLIYRKVIDFCTLTLNPETCYHCILVLAGFFFRQIYQILYIDDLVLCEQRQFYFLPNTHIFYFLLVFLLYRPASMMLNRVKSGAVRYSFLTPSLGRIALHFLALGMMIAINFL